MLFIFITQYLDGSICIKQNRKNTKNMFKLKIYIYIHYDPQQTGAAVAVCEIFHAYGGAQSSELSTEPLRSTPSGRLSAAPRGLRSPSGFKVRGHEDSSVEFKYFGVF